MSIEEFNIQIFLSLGSQINLQDDQGNSSLHLALLRYIDDQNMAMKPLAPGTRWVVGPWADKMGGRMVVKEDMVEAYKDQQINDKIMAFAQKEHRISTIDKNPGTGLKRVSKFNWMAN